MYVEDTASHTSIVCWGTLFYSSACQVSHRRTHIWGRSYNVGHNPKKIPGNSCRKMGRPFTVNCFRRHGQKHTFARSIDRRQVDAANARRADPPIPGRVVTLLGLGSRSEPAHHRRRRCGRRRLAVATACRLAPDMRG